VIEMIKVIALLLLSLFLTTTALANRAIVGYFQQMGPYSDYVIVYTYYQEDGSIGLSHCRAASSASLSSAFLKQTTLDINTCELTHIPSPATTNSGEF
jgi:hypothetical protein